jgi:hypothetical protein
MINQGATLVSRLAVLLVVMFTLAACGGGGDGVEDGTIFYDKDNPNTPPTTTSYTVTLTLLDASGAPTTYLPQLAAGTVQIVVTESDTNAPVSGTLVNATITSGSLDPTSGQTDENGLVSLSIAAGTVLGSVTISATTEINNDVFTGILNYQVVDYLLQLTLLGPNAQPTNALETNTVGTLQALVISAANGGAPAANVLVNASTTIGRLLPTTGQVTTNVSGVALFSVVAGATAGTGAIAASAQVNDLTLNSNFNFQVTDAAIAVADYSLELTLMDSEGQPTNSLPKSKQGTLQAKVTSGGVDGTPVPGVFVAANTAIGTLAPSAGQALSDSNGISTFAVSADSNFGTDTISATLTIGDTKLNRTLNVQVADDVTGLTPHFVELTLLDTDGQPTNTLARDTQGTLQARITAGSENGSPVANELVSATATTGSLLSGNGQGLSDSSGFANFTVVAGSTIGAGSFAASITIGGETHTDILNYEIVDSIP